MQEAEERSKEVILPCKYVDFAPKPENFCTVFIARSKKQSWSTNDDDMKYI